MSIRPAASMGKSHTPPANYLAGKPVSNDAVIRTVRTEPLQGSDPKGTYFAELHRVTQPKGPAQEYVVLKQVLEGKPLTKSNIESASKTLERIEVPKGRTAEFIDNDENGQADRIKWIYGTDDESDSQPLTADVQEYIITPKTPRGAFKDI